MSVDAIVVLVAVPLLIAWTAWRIVAMRRRARVMRELARLLSESRSPEPASEPS